MNKSRGLAEGGVLLAIYAVMLFIVMYIPFAGTIMMFLLPVPFILYGIKHDIKWSFFLLGTAVLLTLVIGSVMAIPITIMFGLVGTIMGYYIRTNKSKLQMFIVSVLVFIACLLFMFVISIVFFDFNIITETVNLLNQAIDQSASIISSASQGEQIQPMIDKFKSSLEFVEMLLPSFLVISSIIFVAIIFVACKPIINRVSNQKFEIEPIRDITLPKSLLWYYLFIMVVSLVFNPEQGSFSFSVISNLLIALQFFILIQGYSLLFYFSHAKGLSKAIPVTVTIFTFLVPIFISFIRILGIIDLGFPIREKITNNKDKDNKK
ncbi:YybS family protein [Bacillus massiliigorillae]|uniref:YybS family protein n=1 Tax=Bacillus massiliigorillae TaxID=1243664 RepID=UPI0003AA0E0B|nr:YybS family protein [Bacillus massiliigorillae]